ncbi:surface exclusion protein, partial [Salmonella enterica]|nr:surface exclusion protein [Salmonella enterica subsp. enterica serovar Kentucky]ECK1050411.1 surface exclusion protein [Salmonella enterica subsp. enterica serovar Kentucky]ECT0426905.1 surface exclusion protein [Salmonella enterica subsp. enterica serovar Kentucky]
MYGEMIMKNLAHIALVTVIQFIA